MDTRETASHLSASSCTSIFQSCQNSQITLSCVCCKSSVGLLLIPGPPRRDLPQIIDYIRVKAEIGELEKKSIDWSRKIEIAGKTSALHELLFGYMLSQLTSSI